MSAGKGWVLCGIWSGIVRSLNYVWRLFGTAVGFFFFGLGGLLLRLVVFPILKLLSPVNLLHQRSRLLLHYSLNVFLWLLRSLGALELKIYGAEKLNRPGQLVLANHPSLLDVVFLISQIRNCNCIGKRGLWRNPFTRGPVLNAGFVNNDDPATMIERCGESLQMGDSLLIFPESTRTTPGQVLRFQRGATQVALRSKAIVTPVVIHGELPALTKEMKWYQIPKRKMSFTLYVGDDLDLSEYTEEANMSVAVRRVTEVLQNYFTHELEKYDAVGK